MTQRTKEKAQAAAVASVGARVGEAPRRRLGTRLHGVLATEVTAGAMIVAGAAAGAALFRAGWGSLPSLDETQQEILRALAGPRSGALAPLTSGLIQVSHGMPSTVSISPGPSPTTSTSCRAVHSATVLGCPSSRQPDRFRDSFRAFGNLSCHRFPASVAHCVARPDTRSVPGRERGGSADNAAQFLRGIPLPPIYLDRTASLSLRRGVTRAGRTREPHPPADAKTAVIPVESTSEAGR
jgi:hypothetical protein